jgi:hypothetical protein
MKPETGTRKQLAQIQTAFLASINHSLNQSSDKLTEHINTTEKLGASARIDIYRNNTQQTHIRTLNDIYPITREVLGEKFFNQQCELFSQQHPAQHWNLNLYGKALPNFIYEQLTSSSQEQLPYLNDLGQMEWHLHENYYATDSDLFPADTFSKLSSSEQEQCQLQLAPPIALLSTNWPIYQFWQSWQTGSIPESLEAVQDTEYLCIFRDKLLPTVETINPSLYQLLSKLPCHTLAELAGISGLSEALPLLPQCIEKGWITDFHIPDNRHFLESTDV